jgi:hypothetical protein
LTGFFKALPRRSPVDVHPGHADSGGLRPQIKAVIFRPMHFSRHISQLHSTFSLLAALKLRFAR